jgi:diadenosine tetraphosphate (Ap4A) HIT family hydrolase
VSAGACRACDGAWPAASHRIADLGIAVASLNEDQFFPGWTFVVLKRHATELYELSAAERHELVDTVARVARALGDEYGAVKVNYELLGNQLPHIHWHVIPRRADDPSPRGPVWTVEHAPRSLGDPERAERLVSLRRRLES